MEWREQSAVSCDQAYLEAQRWIEAVTEKTFGSSDFRSELETGVRLCDLINKIKPGLIKKVNRLSTPIAGLDNLNVFLKACGKLGLKEAQLFDPGDLQDLSSRVNVKDEESSRRLKNVLITIYWLGRRAQSERSYDGPYLNFKAFEGLLGTALYKALQESSSQKGSSVRDSGFGDSWYSEREELNHPKGGGGGGGRSGHKREDSLDSLDSLGSRPHSISSEATLKGSSEGCGSDTEADSVYKMAESKDLSGYRRSVVITPKSTSQFNQFLPTRDKASGYVPAPLRKKRAERNEDNRLSWSSSQYAEDESPLTRQEPIQEVDDGSKSTSDILGGPALTREQRYEELQKFREQVKESDDKWQDDLSKWKSRRRSVNSDIVRKKEEREKIELITSGSNRRSKTFREMQETRNGKGGRLGSLSYLNDDEDVFENPVISPRSRALPARSYTIDTPYTSSDASVTSPEEEGPPAASRATGRAASPPSTRKIDQIDGPRENSFTKTTATTPAVTPFGHSSPNRLRTPATESPQRSPVLQRTTTAQSEDATRTVSSFTSRQTAAEPRRSLLGTQTRVEPPSSSSLYKQQPQPRSMEPNPPVVSRVSASLPRSYQKSDSARLTSVITPRPFGSQTSRIGSLPRPQTMDDSQKRLNGNTDVSKRFSVPSRYHQFMTPEEAAESSSSQSSEEEEEEVATVSPAPAKETSQENSCEMRISLNQKPGSSRDFGFQAAWDSTGARVKSVQPGSPAQMCQLQVGDEVLTVNGHKVAEMSYMGWKSRLEEALQEGSLVMDIRRHGQHRSSESNVVSPSLDFTTRVPPDTVLSKDFSSRQVIDVASNGVNGGFREESVTMRSKDVETEPISLKNLKRRSEFFETGGSGTAMPDIPVPSITPSSSRWSWDPEEERKRQEKWQKEQERVLQEKYKRDQEKLQEEWEKAQQEIATNADQQELLSLEVNSHTFGPRSPLSSLRQPTSFLWEEEERKRKEEQERQRQAEERRKREEEERELLRLQEERKRREREEEEEQKRREEEELRWQQRREEEERKRKEEEQLRVQRRREEEEERKRKEEEEELRWQRRREEDERKRMEEEQLSWQKRREEEQERKKREELERRRQEFAEQQRREMERLLEQQQQQQQWAADSHDFTSVQSSLSSGDRTKSKSSPELDEAGKPPSRGARAQGGMAQWLLEEQLKSANDRQAQLERATWELEQERRDILNAMRYREPERVTGSGFGDRKSLQPSSQAELERQQILNEMKKKTSLLGDKSWIRQRSSSSATSGPDVDVPSMRRGESLDHLDSSYNSWRSSWTPRTNTYVQSQARPHSSLSARTSLYGGVAGAQRPASSTLPSSFSMGSLRGGAGTPSSSWSRQSLSPSSSSASPTTSPEPTSEAGDSPQRSRSVSGRKICTFCENPLGKGAAMIIESLGLCYHLSCFKCFDCKADLGGSEAGAEVRIRSKHLYCNDCYMRFKTGQPTAM